MADSGDSVDKSKDDAKQFTIALASLDKTFEAVVVLEEEEDTSHPPRLVNITKRPLQTPSGDLAGGNDVYETHIILSTGSGHQKATSFFNDVLQPILKTLNTGEQENWTTHTTQSATSILELTETTLFPKANHGTKLCIILASGDGGIVDLVNGLLAHPHSPTYTSPRVILLPLGTANALYHSINAHSPHQHTWGLHALSSPTTTPLPLITATFSPGARLLTNEARDEEPLPGNKLHGAVVASWGMHASLVADSDTALYRNFGVERFKMAAQEALYPSSGAPPHTYRARVSILHGETWHPLAGNEHMYVLVTLVSHLEAPFCISPDSTALDGSLHLVRFGPTSGDEAMRIMGLAYQGGKHVEDPAVRYESVDGVRIAFGGLEEEGRWRRVCVDGKIVTVEGEGWVEVRREGRRVVDVVVGGGDE